MRTIRARCRVITAVALLECLAEARPVSSGTKALDLSGQGGGIDSGSTILTRVVVLLPLWVLSGFAILTFTTGVHRVGPRGGPRRTAGRQIVMAEGTSRAASTLSLLVEPTGNVRSVSFASSRSAFLAILAATFSRVSFALAGLATFTVLAFLTASASAGLAILANCNGMTIRAGYTSIGPDTSLEPLLLALSGIFEVSLLDDPDHRRQGISAFFAGRSLRIDRIPLGRSSVPWTARSSRRTSGSELPLWEADQV